MNKYQQNFPSMEQAMVDKMATKWRPELNQLDKKIISSYNILNHVHKVTPEWFKEFDVFDSLNKDEILEFMML